MKKSMVISLLFLLTLALYPQGKDIEFHKGITYYLLKDTELAKKHLNLYFYNNSNFQLKNGFMLLLDGKNWDATTRFQDYLGINHRSEAALVGIALSTVDMKNTATVENLERAVRLNSRFPSSYLCLGVEYAKRKNYPAAEYQFKKALQAANVPEFKIILANLYLETGQPGNTLNLMRAEADSTPDNFYYNFLTAKALLELNDLKSVGKYIDSALETKPSNQEALLLKAKYFLGIKEYIEAKSILSGLKFDRFNEDYVKTFATALLQVKDRKAITYLYEFFSQKMWDRDINRLMGLYFLTRGKDEKVQNWIYRSILSGNDIDELKSLFPEKFQFPEFHGLEFFEVKKIKWLSENLLLVAAGIKTGDSDRLFFIDSENMKILSALPFRGDFQDIFYSDDLKNMVFSTVASTNESIYLYSIQIMDSNFILNPIFNRPLRMAGVLVGFNRDGSVAYMTDSSLSSLAFESPFSSVSLYGQKQLVYPVYPLPVFKYDFSTRRFTQMKDLIQIEQLERIPVEEIKKYTLVGRAFQLNSKINDRIHRGQKLDLTSSQVVKIFFADDLSGFVIYLSDLTNAFQALIYDDRNDQVIQVDETMFLGKDRYAEIEILHFNPKKNQLLIRTKDKMRDVIDFNYKSHLYSFLSKDILDYCYNSGDKLLVILSERSNNIHYSDTSLELLWFYPFFRKTITARRDLNRIDGCQDELALCFTTYDGEYIWMDNEDEFHYRGVSFAGSEHDISPEGKKAAAFINGKLFVLDWKK
jgi:tetratricopeptide (TPR) repeat protein